MIRHAHWGGEPQCLEEGRGHYHVLGHGSGWGNTRTFSTLPGEPPWPGGPSRQLCSWRVGGGQGITYHFSSLAWVSRQPVLPRGALEGVQMSGEFQAGRGIGKKDSENQGRPDMRGQLTGGPLGPGNPLGP